MTPKKRGVRKARSQTKSARSPRTLKDKIFCDRWLATRDHNEAYSAAGFKYDSAGALRKLEAMKPYLERRAAEVDKVVSKRLSFEREDILEHLAAIGLANAQDYYEPYTYIETHTNPVTGETRESTRQGWALKPIHKLSRLQAYAIDNLIYDVASGRMSYTLPSARLRAKTLTTLGENTKALNPKDPSTGVKRHLHVHATVEELAALEREFARIFGPQEARAVLGLTPDDQQDG